MINTTDVYQVNLIWTWTLEYWTWNMLSDANFISTKKLWMTSIEFFFFIFLDRGISVLKIFLWPLCTTTNFEKLLCGFISTNVKYAVEIFCWPKTLIFDKIPYWMSDDTVRSLRMSNFSKWIIYSKIVIVSIKGGLSRKSKKILVKTQNNISLSQQRYSHSLTWNVDNFRMNYW